MKRFVAFFALILILLTWPLSVTAEGAFQNDDEPTPTATLGLTTAVPEPTATIPPAPPTATATSAVTATPSPLDAYEPDDVPSMAKRIVIEEIQIRSYWRPEGNDVDWAVVYLKPGRWQIAARTTTAIYDPRLTVEGQTADDTGNSKDAVLTLTITDERDYLIFVENVGLDGWGEYTLTVTRLSDLYTPTPYPTYTPLATYTPLPPTPVVLPTYTPYPTLTAYPTASAIPSGSAATVTPQPTYTPYPTYAPYPTSPAPMSYPTPALPYGATGSSGPAPYGSTGSSGAGSGTGDKGAAGSGAGSASAAAPLPPTPSAAKVSLQIFIDSNRNGVMDYGEEAENILVYATTRDRRFEMEGYTSKGEAVLPLTDMTEDEELLLLVPYLHRAASFQQRGGTITSDVALDLPQYPVYLP